MVRDRHSGNNEGNDRDDTALPPSDDSNSQPQDQASQPSRGLHDRAKTTTDRVKSSTAGAYWTRLGAIDFINSSIIFAALGLICLLPFLATLSAAAGGDVRHAIIIRLGLNHQAAASIEKLMSSGSQSVTSLTVFGAIWLLLGAYGISGILQEWYQKVYDRPPPVRVKKVASQTLWIAALLAYVTVQVLIGTQIGPLGGHVLIFLTEFVFACVFWTFSIYLLLVGEVAWRTLLPAGVATGFCLTGLSVFSALSFSSSIVSGDKNYGPVGVVTVLVSYMIGLGVCIHLGAVFGQMWNQRQESPKSTEGEAE